MYDQCDFVLCSKSFVCIFGVEGGVYILALECAKMKFRIELPHTLLKK